MARFSARARRRRPIEVGRNVSARHRLGFEQLEPRLVLSFAPLAEYDQVSPAWFAAAPISLPPSPPAQVADDVARWIIRLTPDAAAQAGTVAGSASLLADLPLTVVRGLGLPGQLLVTSRGIAAIAMSEALGASPHVAAFQRDARIDGAQLPNDPDINTGLHATALSQYGLFNIGQFEGTADADVDADLAWDITTGSRNVVTAVIDSGIFYTHPDLAANIWTNPGEAGPLAINGIDDDGNGFVDDVRGWDFANNDSNPVDDHGHGTHVAGAIGAVGNNGAGVAGVNWSTSLLPLKFLDENNVGSVVDAVSAINYATMMRTRAVNPVNIRVINASWGGAGADQPMLRAAIAASGAADILFVAAAGNGDVFGRGQNIDEFPFFPASYGLDNMLVVAATDRNDQLANFSNFGVNSVDVAAPGLSVWNADLFIDGATTATTFGTRSGTSMATPLVAGTAALAWASAPGATVSEVRDAILAGGDAKASLAGKVASGKRLNAFGVLRSLPPQARVTSAPDVTAIGGTSYQFTVELTSNVGITPASVGNGDFVVRRTNGTGGDLVATLVSPPPATVVTQWTGTYQITPPGGAWDIFDAGIYEISLVAGQLVDVDGGVSRQKVVDTLAVDLSGVGVFRPTVFTDNGTTNSLRGAIQQANAVTPAMNPAGGTVILAPGTYTLSIAGAGEDAGVTGDLDITGKVTIASDGTGAVIINAAGIDRVFDVMQGATLSLSGVTVTGGNAPGSRGGGIQNFGTLTISNAVILNNTADQAGGVYNAVGAVATINQSSIEGNNASLPAASTSRLDESFGNAGITLTSLNLSDPAVRDFAIQSDGKIVVVGEYEQETPAPPASFFLLRYLTDGSLDPAFGTAGLVSTPFATLVTRAEGVVLQPDGKIVVAGYTSMGDFAIARYNPNGSVDTSFSTDGLVDEVFVESARARCIALQADGKIIVAGSAYDSNEHFAIARLNTNGTLDNSFSSDGRMTIDMGGTTEIARAVILQNDGKIVLVGETNVAGAAGCAVVRLTTNGSLDGSFSGDGRLLLDFGKNFDFPNDVIQTRNGSLVIAGDSGGDSALARVTSSGVLDSTFGAGGTALFDLGPYDVLHSIVELEDGRLAGAGYIDGTPAPDFAVSVFSADGRSVDPNFGSFQVELGVTDGALAIAQDDEGRLVAVGNFGEIPNRGAAVVRLNALTPDGGGVYNAGALTATSVTISNNVAQLKGGGFFNASGAIANLQNVTVSGNSSAAINPDPGPNIFSLVGSEFSINAITNSVQGPAEVGAGGGGRALVAWANNEIAGRFVTSAGVSGAEFVVSTQAPAEAGSVAMDGNGGAIVTWGFNGTPLGSARSYQASIDVGGNSASTAYPLSDGINGFAKNFPKVVANDLGSAVAVWDQQNGSGFYDVHARRLITVGGTPGGSEINVNVVTDGNQTGAVAAIDNQGRFVVAWLSVGDGVARIVARIFDAAGNPLTGEFLVVDNMFGYDPIRNLSVTIDEGGVGVAWTGVGVIARFFDFSGVPRTGEVTLAPNSATAYSMGARLISLDQGGFYAVWRNYILESNSYDVHGRQFTSTGVPVGSVATINSTLFGDQNLPSVAQLSPTQLIVVWNGTGGTDPTGVYGAIITETAPPENPNYGGGIANEGDLTLSSSTVTDNSSAGKGGGIVNALSATARLQNTIVADNNAEGDVAGSFISQGGNLVGNAGNATGFTLPTDRAGTIAAPLDAKLGPLADNGGPSKTHLPAADSPALDAAVAGGPAVDQRGVARPADGDNNGSAVSDIGAVERYYVSISGRKFKDQNQNGIQDAGEPGIAGWTMFLDLNQNGQLNGGEPSVVTDGAGDYSFKQLTPGVYTVAEVNQPGWTRTYTATRYASEIEFREPELVLLDGLAMSLDGRHLYGVNNDLGGPNGIVTLNRNLATGALTRVNTIFKDGLNGPGRVVLSPDGRHVYAVGAVGNGLLGYSRNTASGLLTQIYDTTLSIAPVDLALSSDGKNLYVLGGAGSGLRMYSRNTNVGSGSFGELTFLGSRAVTGTAIVIPPDLVDGRENHVYVTNGSNMTTFSRNETSGLLGASPQSVFTNGQTASGGGVAAALSDATDLAASPDGLFVYTLSRGEQAVGVYQRNPASGNLTFIEKLARGGVDSLGTAIDEGLEGATSLVVSPAGDRVYVTGDSPLEDNEEDSVTIFKRSTTTGRLFFADALKQFDPAPGAPLGFFFSLGKPEGIVVSPDGGSIYVASRGAITQLARDGEGVDRKTLLVGEELAGVNFSSYAAPGEIRGVVYSDLNNDGVRDVDEYGLGGVTAYLDLSEPSFPQGDNVLDPGEPTVSTDVLGQYAFTNLTAPANYTVRLSLPASQSVTSPSAAAGREHAVALAPNQTYTGADFLVHSALSGQGTSQISGVVFQDVNRDGVRQPLTEPFLPGRQVYLDVNDNGVFNAGVDIMAGAPTSATGNYSFTGLGSANFVVRVVTLPGELTSTPVGNSFTKQTLTTGANPLGLVTADFNGDNRPDLASADGSADKVSVRLQLAGGGFATRVEYAVGSEPTGIAVGKFNNDAFPDIAVVHWSLSKVVFLINNGNGTFTRGAAATEISLPTGYTTIAAANIDGDSDDDLAIAVDGAADAVLILRNNNGSTPSFTQIQQLDFGTGAPLSIATADLTGDGRPEFVVGNFVGDSVTVLKNIAGTSFTTFTIGVSPGPSSVAIVPDMNGDGHKDVVVASIAANAVTIFNGNGTGGLSSPTIIPVGQGPRSVTVADVDEDNDLDLVIGNSLSNDVVVLRRQGPGLTFSFPESSGLASFSALVASGVKQVLATDLDDNGVLDLAAVRGDANAGSLAVLYNALAPGSLRLSLSGNTVSGQNFGITTPAPAHPGDYDSDLDVDGADFLKWQRTLGSAASPAGSGADGNVNGAIDAADLGVWRNNFGQSFSVAAASGAVLPAAFTSTSNDDASPAFEALAPAATSWEVVVLNDPSSGNRAAGTNRPTDLRGWEERPRAVTATAGNGVALIQRSVAGERKASVDGGDSTPLDPQANAARAGRRAAAIDDAFESIEIHAFQNRTLDRWPRLKFPR